MPIRPTGCELYRHFGASLLPLLRGGLPQSGPDGGSSEGGGMGAIAGDEPSHDAHVRRLALDQGVDPERALVDEHVRWLLYRESLGHIERRATIMGALAGEPDRPLASAVVFQALAVVDPEERQQWVQLLTPGAESRPAEQRARELDLIETLLAPDADPRDAKPADWSQWMQLRLAEGSESAGVLDLLAESGTTKRIRQRATTRARNVGQNPAPGI